MIFCLSIGKIKKLLYGAQKRQIKYKTTTKKKHNQIFYLGKSKADSVEMLISKTIIDLGISHEEFKTTINEKKNYDDEKKLINEGRLTEVEMV